MQRNIFSKSKKSFLNTKKHVSLNKKMYKKNVLQCIKIFVSMFKNISLIQKTILEYDRKENFP